jgi:DNA-binding NarL/FixJ family response regulator
MASSTRIFVIKVEISDAHAVIREGVRAALEHVGDFDVVGEAFDGAGTLSLVRSTDAHVLTLGLSMSGVHGIELIAQIKEERPSLHILVLSMHSEKVFAALAFKAGASGFITKSNTNQEIVEAIKKLRRGGVYVSLEVAEQVALGIVEPNRTLPHQRLTAREYVVFCRIAYGQTPAKIAQALSVSSQTISTYKARILEKMEIPHDVALVRYAMLHKLVEDDGPADPPTAEWTENDLI